MYLRISIDIVAMKSNIIESVHCTYYVYCILYCKAMNLYSIALL